jgi:AP-3 complex subunit beta
VRTDDAEPVKRTKISILLTLCTVDNHQALLREFVVRLPSLFRDGVLITALIVTADSTSVYQTSLSPITRIQDYAQDIDDSVVGDAIDAIGRIARLVPPSTPQCLTALMGMINSKQGQWHLFIFRSIG